MKRSLKPTDLRDMTLGQLQVIVNDLHSQIESELTTHTRTHTQSLTSILSFAEMSKRANGEKHADAYWPLLLSGCESTFIYVSQFKELYQFRASPEHLLSLHCTDHWSCYPGMNNLSSNIRQLQKSPWVQNHELPFTYKIDFPLKLVLHIFWRSWRNNSYNVMWEQPQPLMCG